MHLTKAHLLNFLDEIDLSLDDEITLVAVGGTAMILLDLRPTTKDFDFTGPRHSISTFEQASRIFRRGFKVDCWPDGRVLYYTLPDDYLSSTVKIDRFDMIDLRILNPLDLVVTKLAQNARRYQQMYFIIRTDC